MRFGGASSFVFTSHHQVKSWQRSGSADSEQRLGEKLGYEPSTLARQLKNLSFSELEEFTLDVTRQHVLHLPDSNLKKIVAERLEQWKQRFAPDGHALGGGQGQDA